MANKVEVSLTFVALLAVFSAFGPLSIDMYLPAMPAITRELVADPGLVQLTLSTALLGFGVSPLFWGPVSDRYGRKIVLQIGFVIFVVATIVAALSQSIDVLIAARFFQAVGGATGMVITRAIVRDRFSRDDGAKVLALLFMVMSIAPMAAPTVGGQVLLFAGWRAIFWLLAALGIISLILTVRPLRESLAPDKRTTHKVGAMVTSYGQLLKNRRFVGYALCNAFSFGGMFAYIAGSPFVIIELMGVSPQVYGLLFALHVLGLSAGAFISSRLVTRYGVDKLLAAGAVGIAVAGVAVAIVGYTGAGLIPLLITVVPFMIFLSIVGANSMAGGMAEFPQIAGTASALLGAVPLSCGALVSALVSTFHDGTAVPMTFAMGTVGVLALLTLLFVVRGSAPAAVE